MNPQSSIAHYRITSKIGQGGMGEVWRAIDSKLGREVAIKVLPDAFATDPDRMARFQREAQVLASLNHPNIAAIYGVEERALVMELVPGPTLEERIAHGPVPLEEALPVARQIAEALEYAHERGIVHRDLKPANVKVTPDGRVKVLDFGLAKALSGEITAGDPASSPTLTMRAATMPGLIVGTAAYMSPEQARGQEVDRRADIWAFGVILYEMLTGRRLFEAPTVSDTLAAVLRSDPDWTALPASLPGNIRVMLKRALERDSRRRLRDIGDARLELEQPYAAEAPAAQPARMRTWVPWTAAAVFALAAAATAFLHFREPAGAAPLVRFIVPPPQSGAFSNWLGLSPDGRRLAFTASDSDGAMRIWLRSLDSVDIRPLPGSEDSTNVGAFWSPDSRFLVFEANGRIKKIDISGGPPQSLCESPNVLLGGSWNADGVLLLGNNTGPILRVSSEGGTAVPATRIDPARGDVFQSDPVFLPDGRHFLYFRHASRPENNGIFVGSLDAKAEDQDLHRILHVEYSPGYAPPRNGGSVGHLLFVRDDVLLAQPFDQSRFRVTGEAVPVAERIGTTISRAFFSVSPAGVLAYRSGTGTALRLSWYGRDGRVLGSVGSEEAYQDLALSPDGGRVAFTRPTQGDGPQIWILDFARNTQTRLTFSPQGARSAVWSPDGRYIAYSLPAGVGLFVKGVLDAANPESLSNAATLASDWSRDGSYLVFTQLTNRYDVVAVRNPLVPADRKLVTVAASEFSETHGQISPDGHWIAYESNESGRGEVYVRPFPPDETRPGKWLVSTNGGTQPRWRGDGKELYYLNSSHRVMAVDVNLGGTFQAGTPQSLFQAPAGVADVARFQYDVTRDGKRFLMISPVSGSISSPATVVLNWETALKR